jgi:hypothetical protein
MTAPLRLMRGLGLSLVLAALGLAGLGRAQAQGYGTQAPLGFTFVGQSDQTRLSIEATRQTLSGQQVSGANSGSVGSAGTVNANTANKTQSGSDLNNAVQYYNYATTNVTVTGSNNTVSTGGVLNATQTSSGTNQVLNNQTGSASATTSGTQTP